LLQLEFACLGLLIGAFFETFVGHAAFVVKGQVKKSLLVTTTERYE
jgi:hypothetical protein